MKQEMKNVQTHLTREEYEAFKEALAVKGINIKDGLRGAVLKVIEGELSINADDPFFQRKAQAGSGVRDLSAKHDAYLYKRKGK